MTSGKGILRWSVRLGLLAAALFLAMGGPVPDVLVRVFPGLSPLVAFTSTLAQRRWFLGLYWLAPPAAMIALGFWKGRLFCRWMCPAGTLYSLPTRWSLKRGLLKVRLSPYVFWILVGSSLAAAPLLAFLDPLSTFNRLAPLLRGTYTLASLVPGLLLPLMLVLGVFQPMIWCTHLCPLGYLFELCHSLRRQGPVRPFVRSRREVLAGLLIGVPTAAVARAWLFGKRSYNVPPVLPPGAADPETFAAACTRCYACVEVCPTKVIRVPFDADRAVGQWFQPEVRYFGDDKQPDFGYCPEPCNQCSQVCPAGALTPLTFAHKWTRQIGVAKIIRSACLAWEDGEDCVVCQELCPYQAIEADYSDDGRARPVVNEELCRGCGGCYSKCPAKRAGKAIVIAGVPRQRQVDDIELAPKVSRRPGPTGGPLA